MLEIDIYTDGSTSKNPGPGSWASITKFPDGKEKILTKSYFETTNNRMEMLGPLETIIALGGLTTIDISQYRINVYSDSQYLVKALNEWLSNWAKHDWKTSSGKSVKNKDILRKYIEIQKQYIVSFHWVKGHNGHPENERCDILAKQALQNTNKFQDTGYDG
jgi:ribonuclease HI